jgi:hypothetical protein
MKDAWESFALYQKKASSIKQSYLRHMFKKASTSDCTSTIVVSHYPLSPTPSSSAVKTPENTEDPDGTLNQQIKVISKRNIPLISCTAKVRSVQVPSNNTEYSNIQHLSRPMHIKLTKFCCTFIYYILTSTIYHMQIFTLTDNTSNSYIE